MEGLGLVRAHRVPFRIRRLQQRIERRPAHIRRRRVKRLKTFRRHSIWKITLVDTLNLLDLLNAGALGRNEHVQFALLTGFQGDRGTLHDEVIYSTRGDLLTAHASTPTRSACSTSDRSSLEQAPLLRLKPSLEGPYDTRKPWRWAHGFSTVPPCGAISSTWRPSRRPNSGNKEPSGIATTQHFSPSPPGARQRPQLSSEPAARQTRERIRRLVILSRGALCPDAVLCRLPVVCDLAGLVRCWDNLLVFRPRTQVLCVSHVLRPSCRLRFEFFSLRSLSRR